MNHRFISSIVCLSLLSFFIAPSVLAVGNLGDALKRLRTSGDIAGTSDSTVESVVGKTINIALTLVGLIFLVLMVYAGYLWMTARGEETQIDTAKKIINAAIIGLVIVLSAYAITKLITSRFE